MGNQFSSGGDIPSYQELTRRNTEVFEAQTVDSEGFNFKINRTLSQAFQVSHSIKICNPNQYAGMIQNQPETISKYVFGGHYAHVNENTPNAEPSSIVIWEVSPDRDLGIQTISNITKWLKCRIVSGHDSLQKSALFRELTFDASFPTRSLSLTVAQPTLLKSTGLAFEGIAKASMVQKLNNTFLLGVDCDFRRMNIPQAGLMTELNPAFALSYKWDKISKLNQIDPDIKLNSEATTLVSVGCAANSLIPKSFSINHHAKGGADNCNQALAELTIETDPRPPQFGGTGALITKGNIGCMFKIADTDPQQSIPGMPAPSGTTVRGKISTDLDITMTVETYLAPAPVSVGFKANYSYKKDKLKIGASLTLG